MKLRDHLALYRTDFVTDEKTGKQRKVSVYIGKYYSADERIIKAAKAGSLVCTGVGWLCFLICGLTLSRTSQWVWAQAAYMLTLLPLVYETISEVIFLRIKNPFGEETKQDAISMPLSASIFLAVCGALWTAASIAFMAKFGLGDMPFREVVFLLCGLAEIAAAIAEYRIMEEVNGAVRETTVK